MGGLRREEGRLGGRQASRRAGLSAGMRRPGYYHDTPTLTPSEYDRLGLVGKVARAPAVKLAPTETLPSAPRSAFLLARPGGSPARRGEGVAAHL